jgi:diacylglycerol kinase (ATP)
MPRPDNPDVPRYTGLTRVNKAFLNSLIGIGSAYQSEAAFRQEIWLAAILLPAAFWVGHGTVERLLLIGSVLLVLIVELLNSAIEAVVDRISLEWHDLSKHAKDVGSAAVLLALLNCAAVWIAIAWF